MITTLIMIMTDDNGAGAVAPAPAGGALASLTALGTVLNTVDTASVAGRSGLPMLTFKRDGDGTWAFGQKKTIVEDDSLWAVNPLTFKRGFICFDDANKVIGEKLLPVSQKMPEVAELPDYGFEWQQQWAVNMKCLSGADAGVEVAFKTTTVGGIQAVAGLIDTIRDRLNGGQHDGKISPIVHLEKDSYQKPPHGKIWFPVMTITDWMSLERSGDGAYVAAAAAHAAHVADVGCRAASPPPRRVIAEAHLAGGADCSGLARLFEEDDTMFNADDHIWGDFEVASAVDLKAAGTFRYVADASTRAIVLAYAIGDEPARVWHADGAILDWDNAPDDLRAAFDRGATFRAWNASFDSAIWNYATLGFPFLDAGARHRRDGPGRRLQSADRSRKRLARARRRGQAERRQEADPAVLHRGRGARRSSRRVAALSRLRAPGRRGDARSLSPDAPLPRGEWQQYWAFEHINRRGVVLDMPFVRARRRPRGRRRRRQRPPAERIDRRNRHQGHAGEADRGLAARQPRRRGDARSDNGRRSRRR